MAEIRFERLGKRYGDVDAVKDLTLDIGAEDFLVLLGPSGCGKTTALRMLAGLLPPTTGRITVAGQDITHVPAKRRDVAMVFQNYALYPHLTVAKNIAFPLTLRRLPRAEIQSRVREAADMLQLGELLERRPKELSGGQRQRVALGRAIVRRPAAFLMDEPLSNLDAKLRTATRVELTELHRRLATTFVYVTHDQVEAMTMATRIAIMNEGVLEQVGTPSEVYDEPASAFVAGFIGAPPMNLLPGMVGSDDGAMTVSGPGYRGVLFEGRDAPRAVLVGVRPEHLAPVPSEVPGEAATGGIRMQAEVVAVENLGSEEIALCRVGGRQVAVRGPRPLAMRPGDAVELHAPATSIRLFDATSGRRLVWRSDAEAGRRPAVSMG